MLESQEILELHIYKKFNKMNCEWGFSVFHNSYSQHLKTRTRNQNHLMNRTAFLSSIQMVLSSSGQFIPKNYLKNEQIVRFSGHEKQNGYENASIIQKPEKLSSFQVMRDKMAANKSPVLGCLVWAKMDDLNTRIIILS